MDATGVLNFIVVNPAAGGSLMTNAQTALNAAWGKYRAVVKINNGRSQWGASANFKLTNHMSAYREYAERFTMPDGTKLNVLKTCTADDLSDTYGGGLQLTIIISNLTQQYFGSRSTAISNGRKHRYIAA